MTLFVSGAKDLDQYNAEEGDKLKSKLERRYYLNSKLTLQVCHLRLSEWCCASELVDYNTAS